MGRTCSRTFAGKTMRGDHHASFVQGSTTTALNDSFSCLAMAKTSLNMASKKLTLHRPSGRIAVTMEDEMRPSLVSLNEITEAMELKGF